jgi:hypothetical protein
LAALALGGDWIGEKGWIQNVSRTVLDKSRVMGKHGRRVGRDGGMIFYEVHIEQYHNIIVV